MYPAKQCYCKDTKYFCHFKKCQRTRAESYFDPESYQERAMGGFLIRLIRGRKYSRKIGLPDPDSLRNAQYQ